MGLFGKKKRIETPAPDDRVYYSTPFGDTNDGQTKFFLLERDGIKFLPVFRDAKSLKEFYKIKNRAAYVILEGTLKSVIDTTRSIELMRNVNIVIEPLSAHPVEIKVAP